MKAGNALVETVPQTEGLKAPLRANNHNIQDKDQAAEDAALIRDEERLMDEEITSDEESATAADKMERKHLTVALVKSVVESGSASPASPTSSSGEGSPRYGLRKRRRPAGDDLKRLEHSQATNSGGLARSSAGIKTGRSRSGSKSAAPTSSGAGLDWTAPPATMASSSTVPNPLALSSPADPPPASSAKRPASTTAAPDPGKVTTAAVPCPLPASAPSSETAQEASVAPPTTGDPPADKRKVVTINEHSNRSRGFSIDLESVGLDFPEESSSNAADVDGAGRGRAFSFECFAFGINADEPLPPLGQHNAEGDGGSSTGRPRIDSLVLEPPGPVPRPRGDSIIFDPSSFQDGGIHEQSALEKARAPSSDIPGLPSRHPGAPKPDQTMSRPPIPTVTSSSAAAPPSKGTMVVQPNTVRSATTKGVAIKPAPSLPTSATTDTATKTAPVPPQTSSSSASTLPAVTSYTATTTTTTNASTTTTVTVTASSNTATLSMDLLNKDGRIGIYLPEARKARIARFHAKRARRIWRKRIKYDCRKKLADSRPRIKGRFVKRSDMEDE
eukprot:CAMPEP_0168755226 /NCGR_PEP_ID=MMETSP0724-20121128/19948_1 /TAXON_ID=265536 /ORGANISM="Amphiprora sp., Strain CCMP467" /LENGTH=558 /DNA_ID=CAMNT_0008803811 /DNA_START=534 /DNA_END=2210 /DNA_ORIENTATION=-